MLMEATLAEKQGVTDAPQRILFVCSGNTCRSPMAAAIYNALAVAKGETGRIAVSAGLCASDGAPITSNAAKALAAAGILPHPTYSYEKHTAQSVNEALMADAALIVGVTRRHALELMMRYPQYATRIVSLAEDVADPFCGTIEIYMSCLSQLQRLIEARFFAEDTP